MKYFYLDARISLRESGRRRKNLSRQKRDLLEKTFSAQDCVSFAEAGSFLFSAVGVLSPLEDAADAIMVLFALKESNYGLCIPPNSGNFVRSSSAFFPFAFLCLPASITECVRIVSNGRSASLLLQSRLC